MDCKTSIVYRSLWVAGAALILISIPLYKQHAAFYTLLIIGVAMLCVGLILWVRQQNSANAPRLYETLETEVEVEVTHQRQPNPQPYVTVLANVSSAPTPTPTPTPPVKLATVTATASDDVVVSNKPDDVATTKRKKAIRSSLKKDTARNIKKKETVRLSEKANVKEFSKFEAPDMVAEKVAFTVDTKGGGGAPALPSPFSPDLVASPRQHFIYPTVEDIRTERERFANRPETVEVDRKRRVGLVREYALELGHPRDGSLLPFIGTAIA